MTRYAPFALLLVALSLPAQTVVDLTAWQTPLRFQGNRNTCVTFAAVAALEARYRRLGLDLDLSEEFVSSVGKMNWLHATWAEITTSDTTENQLIGTGGGGGCGVVFQMQHWLRAPVESAMPYRDGSTAYAPPHPWGATHWLSQRNVNTWNLDPANLPRAALTQTNYYSVASQVQMSYAESRNPAAIEAVLRNGYEVVWDFDIHPTGTTGSIWRAASHAVNGAHSLLIVGYNRSSSNPANHYFIAKNSWGATANPGGYTYIGYDYIANQGYDAAYITAARTPGPWTEVKFLGRRNLCFDGWRGTLDVYHIPHSFEESWLEFRNLTMTDRRVGTFYDTSGNAFRVNGWITGNELTIWWKDTNPNMRWDESRETPTLGGMFKLRIVDGGGDELAGVSWGNPGPTPNPGYGIYARRPTTMSGNSGFLTPVFPSQPSAPAQWLGKWRVQCAGRSAELVVATRNDQLLPANQQTTHAGFQCHLREGSGSWQPCVAMCELASPRNFSITFPAAFLGGAFGPMMLNWQRGVAAGYASISGLLLQAGYMVRTGEHSFGSIGTFGSGCGPQAGVPSHTVVGIPELGQALQFRLANGAPNQIAILAFGLSRTNSNGTALPFNLAPLGASGCWVRVDPAVTLLGTANSSGACTIPYTFHAAVLRGWHIYSQYFVFSSSYNALGMALSNGADVLLGGSH